MFGRRHLIKGNAVDAAQRRLAALAEQFQAEEAAREPGAPDLSSAAPGRHLDRDDADRRAQRRWRLTPHHLALLALTVAVVIAVAAWFVTRAVPRPQPVQLSSERAFATPAASSPAAGVPSESTPSAGTPATTAGGALVVVDVTGKVRRPGIVELASGSRVIDALKAAGGTPRHVDTSSLNLARLLVDGEQIVVGVAVPTGVAPPPAGTAAPTPTAVNLNTATLEQLDTLPGVGPVTAQAILDWRSEHGAFSSVDELLEVSGIGDVTLAELEAYVYV